MQYTWNRGHLVYPSTPHALHNTLLLDASADSLILDVRGGTHTRSISVFLEHPQLNQSEPVQLTSTTECQLSLPTGPLYGRIQVQAQGDAVHTTYVVHLIRIDASANVSFGSGDFHEDRRLLYLQQNPTWYIPNIDAERTSSLRVRFRPVAFAPLTQMTAEAMAGVPMVADKCQCGSDSDGFGDSCEVQRVVEQAGSSCCIFLFVTIPEVRLYSGKAGIGGMESDIVLWLKNTSISGKFVSLSATETRQNIRQGQIAGIGENILVRFQNVKNEQQIHGIDSEFRLELPAHQITQKSMQLLISATEDQTDAEILSVPLVLVSHAPPVSLIFNSSNMLLLPAYDMGNLQQQYRVCGKAGIRDISATVADSRFQVINTSYPGGIDCNQGQYREERVHFSVVRKASTCNRICHRYRPRAQTYDMTIIHSADECLREAINLQDLAAVIEIFKTMISRHSGPLTCFSSFLPVWLVLPVKTVGRSLRLPFAYAV